MNPKENNWSKHTGIYFQIGLIISLAITLAAFEWKSYEPKTIVDLGTLNVEEDEMIEIPITKTEIPKRPKIQPVIKVVEDKEIIEEIEELIFEPDDVEEVPEVFEPEEEEVEEVVDQVFDIVEKSAAPVGGLKAFYKFISKKLKYPRQAKRMNIEGRVYIQFVVDKDGQLTEVKALRGIGAGCDEEAIRIVKMAPKWNPGKQRGRPVKQRMVIPINFTLN